MTEAQQTRIQKVRENVTTETYLHNLLITIVKLIYHWSIVVTIPHADVVAGVGHLSALYVCACVCVSSLKQKSSEINLLGGQYTTSPE